MIAPEIIKSSPFTHPAVVYFAVYKDINKPIYYRRDITGGSVIPFSEINTAYYESAANYIFAVPYLLAKEDGTLIVPFIPVKLNYLYPTGLSTPVIKDYFFEGTSDAYEIKKNLIGYSLTSPSHEIPSIPFGLYALRIVDKEYYLYDGFTAYDPKTDMIGFYVLQKPDKKADLKDLVLELVPLGEEAMEGGERLLKNPLLGNMKSAISLYNSKSIEADFIRSMSAYTENTQQTISFLNQFIYTSPFVTIYTPSQIESKVTVTSNLFYTNPFEVFYDGEDMYVIDNRWGCVSKWKILKEFFSLDAHYMIDQSKDEINPLVHPSIFPIAYVDGHYIALVCEATINVDVPITDAAHVISSSLDDLKGAFFLLHSIQCNPFHGGEIIVGEVIVIGKDNKIGISDYGVAVPAHRSYIYTLNSPPFTFVLDRLRELESLKGVFVDAFYGLNDDGLPDDEDYSVNLLFMYGDSFPVGLRGYGEDVKPKKGVYNLHNFYKSLKLSGIGYATIAMIRKSYLSPTGDMKFIGAEQKGMSIAHHELTGINHAGIMFSAIGLDGNVYDIYLHNAVIDRKNGFPYLHYIFDNEAFEKHKDIKSSTIKNAVWKRKVLFSALEKGGV